MQSRKLEREMRLGTMTSRRALIERERAMEAARNPGVSKFGDCLVYINSKTDKALSSNLRRINTEIRRMELQISQKIKYFVKHSTVLNHDPLILVERPASLNTIQRALTMTHYDPNDNYPPLDDGNKPGYMKQLRSKARTPSTLTTIDAFTVITKKKKNIWEGAANEKEKLQFQSTVRPYTKLTNREISDLQKGYEFHKPKLNIDETGDGGDIENKVHTKKSKEGDNSDSDFDDVTPFITQMSSVRRKRKGDHQEKANVDVSISKTAPLILPTSDDTIVTENNALAGDQTVTFKHPMIMLNLKNSNSIRKLKTKETETTI